MYFCHLLLISSASIRFLLVCVLYCAHLHMKYSLGISNFLEENSSHSHSVVFFYSFAVFIESLSYLLLLFFGSLNSGGCTFPFLIFLSLLFFSQLFVSPPQKTILPFCISFPWGWFWSPLPIKCYEIPSIVLQALYQI